MNIAIIGYGKMGKIIEELAEERGHKVVLKITTQNVQDFTKSNLQMADLAIEFTTPDSAFDNISKCLDVGLPVVSGTTGWGKKLNDLYEKCIALNGSFLWASNFSVGVNLFFELNRQLAAMMNDYESYNVSITETHHTEKKDKPSGTAITLAKQILDNIKRKQQWTLKTSPSESFNANTLSVMAKRIPDVSGIHKVSYKSDIDDIEIKHTAHSRKGFGLGAIMAAEYIINKKGIFTMNDVLWKKSKG